MSRISAPRSTHREQIAAQMAQVLKCYGLRQPAIFLLEFGRPVVFLTGQLLYVAQPALSLFWPYEQLTRFGEFLEDPDAVPQLLAHLEVD